MGRGRPKAVLELSAQEREELERWVRRPKSAQALALRARIVLRCADGLANFVVAEELGLGLEQLVTAVNPGAHRVKIATQLHDLERAPPAVIDQRLHGSFRHRWHALEDDSRQCRDRGHEDTRHGRDDAQPHRQRYRCTACDRRFDDLSGTVLAGHHRPLQVWVLCLYLMGLNLSNRQIAQELGLSVADVQAMTEHLRSGLVAKTPAVVLEGVVEVDEVYVVAGHKGHPAAVAKKAARGDGGGSRAHPVAAHWRKKSRRSSA